MTPRAYLIIPQDTSLDHIADKITALRQHHDIACVLLKGDTEDKLNARSKILRDIFSEDGISILIEDQPDLINSLDVDGLHLTGDEQNLAQARALLGADITIGADAGLSRHTAMVLGEAGADYVAFSGSDAEKIDEMCAWWTPLFELPCVFMQPEKNPDINHKKHCDFYSIWLTG